MASALRMSTPSLRAATDADHHAHRRGESERARAGDDEHGDGVGDGVGEPRLGSPDEPGDERERGDRQHRRDKPRRDLVGQGLNRRAAALGLRHQVDDLREHGFAADALRPHHDAARRVHRAAEDFRADGLLHRNGLAGEHGFVNRSAAFHDFAVHRNLLAGSHAQQVARMHGIERHVLVAGRRHAAGGFGARPSRALMAPLVRWRARSSSTWPSNTSTVMTAAASK